MAFDFPNAPSTGQVATGPNGAQWRWDSTKWVASSAWQTAMVVISDTPPANPVAGALWWDSVGGQLYAWFTDQNSSQWVIANSGGIPEAPTTGAVYARSNSQWTDITGAVDAAPNNTGRNLLHNGTFVVQQRGAGPWTTTGYTVDRWVLSFSTDTGTLATGAINDATRAAIGDESATNNISLTWTGTSGAGAYTQIQQPIENVRRLSGKTVAISFWAQAGAALPVCVSLVQAFGSGGSPSAAVYVTGATVNLTTSWARYSVTIAVPSTSGKTLGTNNDSATWFRIWFSNGSGGAAQGSTIGVQSGAANLWGAQLELGTQATALDAGGTPQQILAECQRFYQLVYVYGGVYAPNAGNPLYVGAPLTVSMRAAPAVAIVQNSSSNLSSPGTGVVGAAGATSVYANGSATAAGNVFVSMAISASADL